MLTSFYSDPKLQETRVKLNFYSPLYSLMTLVAPVLVKTLASRRTSKLHMKLQQLDFEFDVLVNIAGNDIFQATISSYFSHKYKIAMTL